jgi:hypothetical protein
MERVDGKAAGDYGFITCQRIGLADGGEGGYGAAKPDPVIHRYRGTTCVRQVPRPHRQDMRRAQEAGVRKNSIPRTLWKSRLKVHTAGKKIAPGTDTGIFRLRAR